jgi:outer membrane murein-binding lipoprotein Lpp
MVAQRRRPLPVDTTGPVAAGSGELCIVTFRAEPSVPTRTPGPNPVRTRKWRETSLEIGWSTIRVACGLASASPVTARPPVTCPDGNSAPPSLARVPSRVKLIWGCLPQDADWITIGLHLVFHRHPEVRWRRRLGRNTVPGMTLTPGELQRKVRQLDNDMQATYSMLADITATQKRMGTRLDSLEEKVDALDTKFTSKIDHLETRFDGLETRFDGLETKVDALADDVSTVLEVVRALG